MLLGVMLLGTVLLMLPLVMTTTHPCIRGNRRPLPCHAIHALMFTDLWWGKTSKTF